MTIRWKLSAALCWTALVLGTYYHLYKPYLALVDPLSWMIGWPTIRALGSASLWLATTSSLVLVMSGGGLWILTRLFHGLLPRGERLIFSFGLGTGTTMLVLWGLGMSGLWYPWIFNLVLGVSMVAALFAFRIPREPVPEPATHESWSSWPLREKLLSIALIMQCVLFLFHALAPEISYDALTYHLGFPNQWLIQHRITPLPAYCFSGLPLNMEMLNALALSVSGEIVAKLLHFTFGIALLAAVYLLVRRFASRAAGLAAGLIFLTSPMIPLELVRSAADLTAAFFGILAGYALVLALDQEEAVLHRFWVLSGIFCGLAMGCKYLSWGLLPSLVFVGLWEGLRRGRRQAAWRGVSLLSLSAVLTVSPWLLRNILFLKNPLYPFLHSFFQPAAGALVHWDMLRSEGARQWSSWRSALQIFMEPWTSMTGTTSGGNYLGPAYLLFLPVLLFRKKGRVAQILAGLFMLQWLVLSLFSYLPRFWISALVFLAAILGEVVDEPGLGSLATAALLLISVFNLAGSHRFLLGTGDAEVVLGKIEKGIYLNQTHINYESPYFRTAEFINHQTPQDARILALGDARSFYLHRPVVGSSLFDENPFLLWANTSRTGEELYSHLQTLGVTHLWVNAMEAARMRRYWASLLNAQGASSINDFWKTHVRLLFFDHEVTDKEQRSNFVYEIVPAPLGTAPKPPENVFLEIYEAR